MINAILITCMLATAPAQPNIQQKDTTTVVIKFPKIKKPTKAYGNI